MTNKEWMSSLTTEELALFLSDFSIDDVVLKWFSENYCDKCSSIKTIVKSSFFPYHDIEVEISPCENGENPCGYANCDVQTATQLWLNAEYENLKNS